jgi:hypothetical protein
MGRQSGHFCTTRACQKPFTRGRGRRRDEQTVLECYQIRRWLSALSSGAMLQRERPWPTCGGGQKPALSHHARPLRRRARNDERRATRGEAAASEDWDSQSVLLSWLLGGQRLELAQCRVSGNNGRVLQPSVVYRGGWPWKLMMAANSPGLHFATCRAQIGQGAAGQVLGNPCAACASSARRHVSTWA